jgi:chloramphenicol 3-O-phosphotransferase
MQPIIRAVSSTAFTVREDNHTNVIIDHSCCTRKWNVSAVLEHSASEASMRHPYTSLREHLDHGRDIHSHGALCPLEEAADIFEPSLKLRQELMGKMQWSVQLRSP